MRTLPNRTVRQLNNMARATTPRARNIRQTPSSIPKMPASIAIRLTPRANSRNKSRARCKSGLPHFLPPSGNAYDSCVKLASPTSTLHNATTEVSIMTSDMPPIPPGNRSNKGPKATNKQVDSKDAVDRSVKGSEKHHNAGEEGETGNIKQNTTNKGFFRGRRMG
jgi:hypothetical protein